MLLLDLVLELFKGLEGLGTEDEDGDNGAPGHEAHPYVAQGPHQIGLADGAEDHRRNHDGLEEADHPLFLTLVLSAEEVDDARFRIEIIGHDSANASPLGLNHGMSW